MCERKKQSFVDYFLHLKNSPARSEYTVVRPDHVCKICTTVQQYNEQCHPRAFRGIQIIGPLTGPYASPTMPGPQAPPPPNAWALGPPPPKCLGLAACLSGYSTPLPDVSNCLKQPMTSVHTKCIYFHEVSTAHFSPCMLFTTIKVSNVTFF